MMPGGYTMSNLINIFDIQRFCLHDGPGIRTTVFFQGCPLHCPWCANPESQRAKKHLFHFNNKCTACGLCSEVCPQKAISVVSGTWEMDREKCLGCEKCSEVCLQNAIKFSGEQRSVDQIMSVVLRDVDYYDASQGGLTVSGGEPFAQTEGLLELLKEAKRQGLNTAIETCGHTATKNMLLAEPYTDLFLFDLKHGDARVLRQATGGDLDLILGNLKALSASGPEKILLRVPVIPGFNFDEGSLSNIFRIALERNLQRVELLPYHTLGQGKYVQMGMKYPLGKTPSLTSQDLEPYRQLGIQMGLTMIS